jgi:hypothetical protein
MKELPIESNKARAKKGHSGLHDEGHLEAAVKYAHGCRIGDRNHFEPPEGPVKEPNLTNGVPMLPQRGINSGNKK